MYIRNGEYLLDVLWLPRRPSPLRRTDAACSVAIDGEATCSLRSSLPTRKEMLRKIAKYRKKGANTLKTHCGFIGH
jgi:hypothetical protein